MEFQCLWLTTAIQYKSWKTLLHNFPYPIKHKDYKDHLNNLVKKHITLCIWSEEEFMEVPLKLRKELSITHKPALLVVSERRFACKAFELGFSYCIHKSDIGKQLFSTLVDMLTPFFKPNLILPISMYFKICYCLDYRYPIFRKP